MALNMPSPIAGSAGAAPLGDTRRASIAAIEPIVARVGGRNQLLVRIETEDGLVGWGESGLSSREGAVAAVIDNFAGFLPGAGFAADRPDLATMLPQPVFRRRPGSDRRDVGHRHRPA